MSLIYYLSSLGRVDEAVLNYDLIEDILDELLLKNSSVFTPLLDGSQDFKDQLSAGSVLIFLPGLEEIRTLMERLKGSKIYGNAMHFQILPLHSTLSSTEQKLAFLRTPPGCRKIIISTNVAETSVTIPDVVYVIDSGRVREITRNKKSNSRKLVTTWCSKASVKQRSGRAGRVQPGICLKLYSSRTENRIMREATEPELLRIPLEEVCLTILAGGFSKNCSDFLSQTPQPPLDEAVRSAIKVLEDIGAITTSDFSSNEISPNRKETLTSLGNHLAKLPLDARVGKMLIFGALFKCTDSIVTIAAFLSAPKAPFVSNTGDRHNVGAVHSKFLHPQSDFCTIINLWNAFKLAVGKGKEKDFCRQNFLSYAAMRDIQYARRHYLELLCELGFLDLTGIRDEIDERNFDEKFKSHHCNKNANLEFLVHAVIYAGLFPNVANVSRASAHGDFTVLQKTELLHIQSSVTSKLNVTLPSSWITYYEKFGTERRVSVSKIAFISAISLLLFSPNMQILHAQRKVIVDGWIEIIAAAKTGVFFQEFQNRFANFLKAQFDGGRTCNQTASMSKKVENIIDLVIVLLSKG
jgi:HrpA-like RNA helicase